MEKFLVDPLFIEQLRRVAEVNGFINVLVEHVIGFFDL